MRIVSRRLIDGSDMDLLDLKDEEYESPPIGWAVHGWTNPPAGNHGRQRKVVELLLVAGATVEPNLLESDAVRSNAAILAALRRE